MLLSCFLIFNDDVLCLQTLNFNNSIVNGSLSFFVKLSICFFSTIYFVFIADFLEDQKTINFEFLIVVLFAILGLMLLSSSYDLLTSYLSIELISLSSYLLTAFKKDSTYSVDAGLKYFVTGSISSAFFLLGSSFIYACCGSIFFVDIHDLLDNTHVEYKPFYIDINFKPISSDKIFEDIFYKELSLNSIKCRESNENISVLIEDLLKQTKTQIQPEKNFIFLMGSNALIIGMLFVLFSVFIKLALAPFHLWSLDVYEGASTNASFFFATITKIGFFVFLVRFCYVGFLNYSVEWQFYSACTAVISIVVGTVGGLFQLKLKTLFAYSSVSHMGYCVLAFCTISLFGVQVLFFYLIIYTISSMCIWYIIMLLKRKTNVNFKYSKELADLIQLNKSNPSLSFSLIVAMLSLAGLPPLIGFVAKLNVFLALLKENFYFLCAFVILSSVISTFYYLRIVKTLYFENILIGKLYYPVKTNKVSILSILTLILLFLFANPSLLFLLVHKFICNFL